jgi:hypothetical protein
MFAQREPCAQGEHVISWTRAASPPRLTVRILPRDTVRRFHSYRRTVPRTENSRRFT